MRVVSWLVGLAVAVVAVSFAVSNRGEARLALWPLSDGIAMPQYMAVLAPFVVGLLVGGLMGAAGALRLRLRAREQERHAAALERELKALRRPEAVNPPALPPRAGERT